MSEQQPLGQNDRAKMVRCAICGRVGRQRFKTLHGLRHEPSGVVINDIVVCESETACKRRRSRRALLHAEELQRAGYC